MTTEPTTPARRKFSQGQIALTTVAVCVIFFGGVLVLQRVAPVGVASVTRCEDGRATVQVTNRTQARRGFAVTVAFTDAAGTQVGSATAYIADVPAGSSASGVAAGSTTGATASCRVLTVD